MIVICRWSLALMRILNIPTLNIISQLFQNSNHHQILCIVRIYIVRWVVCEDRRTDMPGVSQWWLGYACLKKRRKWRNLGTFVQGHNMAEMGYHVVYFRPFFTC